MKNLSLYLAAMVLSILGISMVSSVSAVTPEIVTRHGALVSLLPGELKGTGVKCNPDETATGGGYIAGADIIVFASHDLSADNDLKAIQSVDDGWVVAAKNTGTDSQPITAEVNCLKIVG